MPTLSHDAREVLALLPQQQPRGHAQSGAIIAEIAYDLGWPAMRVRRALVEIRHTIGLSVCRVDDAACAYYQYRIPRKRWTRATNIARRNLET